MESDWRTLKSTSAVLAIAICLVLILQGFTVNAGISGNDIHIGTQHAVTGHVYWPGGSLEDTAAVPVTVTNNRTGESGVVLVDVLPGGNPNGTYQVDLSNPIYYPSGYLSTDVIYVNCTYQNMWAKNETTAGGTFSICDLSMIWLSLGPDNMPAASGGSVTGFDGTVTLDIPPGALGSDTVIFGVNATVMKPGSVASAVLGPDGTTFSPPATLKWSYAGLDLGDMSPQALRIYTGVGGNWTALPSTVDRTANLVIAEVNHFSNFSLGGASITGLQTDINYTYPGANSVPILDLALTNTDTSAADTLDYIHVVSNCTDDADVTGVSLWNDSNDNAVIDAGELQLGVTQPLAGGNTNFTGIGETIPANTTLNVLVCLDVNASATIDNYLDLLIPMNGVGLANAGQNIEAVDPAGNTTINQDLTDPHVVYGHVTNIFGNVSNAWVNLTNNRTGSVENLMTDSLGRYDVNIGLMPDGYLDGDVIFVMSNDTLGQTGWNTTIVDAAQFGEQCDIYIGQGPVAGNETPANGSVIANLTQNVTINITATGSPLDLSTIILEVNGTNYSWPDPVLSFAGATLTFDTVLAVGAWPMGQIVNATLWRANDTIGNPCVNAPYSWVFSIIVNMVGRPANLTLSNNASAVMLEWDSVQYADSYNIYRSADRFAAWPWAKIGNNVTATNWTDIAGTYDDANSYFYMVRAYNPAGEGGNSSMGTKIRKTFTYNDPTLNTNTNWVSLPYNSNFNTLSDIVIDIEGATVGPGHSQYISGVYIWDASIQGVNGLTGSNFTGWFGFDLPINPGDGIWIELSGEMIPAQKFSWTIVGTDMNSTQNFTYNDPAFNTNTNWISLPYTSTYTTLSDIVRAVEGSTVGPGHSQYISGVYIWDAGIQGVNGLTGSNFTGWFGFDLAINPGDGIWIELSGEMSPGQTFSWNPELITSSIPETHYYD